MAWENINSESDGIRVSIHFYVNNVQSDVLVYVLVHHVAFDH